MAISTICWRGASGFEVHQFAIDCMPPTSISAEQPQRPPLIGVVERTSARILRDEHRDLGGHLLEHPVEHRRGLGVGGLAEQHAPRVAALLDEREERIESDRQARGPGIDLHAHERGARCAG